MLLRVVVGHQPEGESVDVLLQELRIAAGLPRALAVLLTHVVAVKEAHESDPYAADAETKARFASDLDNLTVATPQINQERGAQAADG